MTKQSKTIKTSPVRERLSIWSRHPFVIPIATFMVLFFATLVIFVNAGATTIGASDVRLINLTVEDRQQVLPTRAKTVGELLERLEIELGEADVVTPGQDTPIEQDNLDVRIYKARPVLVVDGNKRRTVYTAEPDPMRVARDVGFRVHPEDRVVNVPVETLAAEEVIREGVIAERMVIDRALETRLHLYGTVVDIRTHVRTVGELLEEKQIELNDGDTVEPALDTPLKPGVEVFIVREGQQIVQQEEPIAPPVEYVDDYELVLGSTQVRDPGTPGRKIVARGRKSPVVAGNKAEIMAAAGISPNEYFAADFIISKESGWRVNVLNRQGCAGLGQACPGSKLATVCPSWQTDPVCQMRFFDSYARNRYGSWSAAYQRWQSQRWW